MSATIQEIQDLMRELVLSQKETDARFKETQHELAERFRETDIKFQETAERFRETDAQFKDTAERFRETDAKFKETDKRIKEAFELFEGQWGKLIESLVEGDLVNLLRGRGIDIHRTTQRVHGNYQGTNYEFDIIAHDGDAIVVVEVKTTLRVQHVKQFVKKLAQVRTWLREYSDYKVYGAVAYLRSDEGSSLYAQRERLFVIRATGNSATIVNEAAFEPKAF